MKIPMVISNVEPLGYLGTSELSKILKENAVISPFERQRVEGVHYNIQIGDMVWISPIKGLSPIIYLDPQRPYTLFPGKVATIRSEEVFHLPANIIITIDSPDAFPINGILILAPKVLEPGAYQHLFVTVKNISDDDYVIKNGDDLAKLFFERISPDKGIKSEENLIKEPLQYPPSIDEEFPTHPELVRTIRGLRKDVDQGKRNDHLLLDHDLMQFGDMLIKPFVAASLSPEGYPLRVGNRENTYYFDKHGTGKDYMVIGEGKPCIIRAGYTILLRTKEQIFLPDDVNVTFTPLANLLRRNIQFAGTNDISLGYRGFVWCYLHNNGTTDVQLEYEEPIIGAKFDKLGAHALNPIGKGKDSNEYSIDELPRENELQIPESKWEDLVALTNKVNKLEEDMREFGATKVLIELFFIAILAGVVIAIIVAFLSPLLKVLFP